MRTVDQGLVEIVREFVDAHQLMRSVIDRYRSGTLRFEHLQELVGDDESSVLFRLKEHCHALFRVERADSALQAHREALFDLAVGSLFHEAMKFRENFYQREVYGPRVRALRSRAGSEEAALFDEFEKILAAVSPRLEEGLREAEKLLDQTVQQLRILLEVHRDNGFVARFLLEHPAAVEQIFQRPFEDLLTETYGSSAEGYRRAGRSYLMSGYYDAALETLAAARERGATPAEIDRLSAYARGMAAYLARSYADCVEHLAEWSRTAQDDPLELRRLAQDAVSRVGQLVEKVDRERVQAAAAALLEDLATATSA
ncbi:MAG: hypothetical protein OEM49_08125 [Myxococcales bacterium]|nr:hypothetical protein [Myxococcales bacterium]MDH5306470.1 hypothetical protein [Myxococcales bacterium]MDH5565918.1 hypothetical protein [Myxococcales bacterium]